MSSNNYFIMLLISFLGSFLTAFAFAASSSGRFQLATLTLPGVIQTASMVAIAFGVLVSPLTYWCLRGKNLLIVLPTIYVLAPIITVLLSLIDQRIGLGGAFVFWVLVLLAVKQFGPTVTG